jgi:DNA-binding CsgD family transcriptional regulator
LENSESTFGDKRLSKLTQGQRDCLRLVGQYLSSKEIARVLDISPHTVDQRLKRATALLEVPTRFDAARLFMRHNDVATAPALDDQLYEPLVYQRPDLSNAAQIDNLDSSPGTLDRPGDEVGDELHEFQERYFANASRVAPPPSIWSVLVGAQHDNELSVQARVVVMVLIAMCAVMGFAALVSVAEGLSRIS